MIAVIVILIIVAIFWMLGKTAALIGATIGIAGLIFYLLAKATTKGLDTKKGKSFVDTVNERPEVLIALIAGGTLLIGAIAAIAGTLAR